MPRLLTKKLLKRALPSSLGHFLHRRLRGLGIPYRNVYHCCTWKSASQWFIELFSHPVVMEYTQMGVVTIWRWFTSLKERGLINCERPDDVRSIISNKAPATFQYPEKSIATSLYYSFEEFRNLPLFRPYKAFFVMRDPRDLVVSYYFSMKKSHVPHPWVEVQRKKLLELSKDEGLRVTIETLNEEGVFQCMRSWARGVIGEPEVRIFRYEDLSRDHRIFLQELFSWLSLKMPADKFDQVVADTDYERLSGGRKRGEEDASSHLRKGIVGDWANHLDDSHLALLCSITDDIVTEVGYS